MNIYTGEWGDESIRGGSTESEIGEVLKTSSVNELASTRNGETGRRSS